MLASDAKKAPCFELQPGNGYYCVGNVSRCLLFVGDLYPMGRNVEFALHFGK